MLLIPWTKPLDGGGAIPPFIGPGAAGSDPTGSIPGAIGAGGAIGGGDMVAIGGGDMVAIGGGVVVIGGIDMVDGGIVGDIIGDWAAVRATNVSKRERKIIGLRERAMTILMMTLLGFVSFKKNREENFWTECTQRLSLRKFVFCRCIERFQG